jgi:hypothetical protein
MKGKLQLKICIYSCANECHTLHQEGEGTDVKDRAEERNIQQTNNEGWGISFMI